MNPFRVRHQLTAALLVAVASLPSFASSMTYSGSIGGSFSDLVLSGTIRDPALNQMTPQDNSNTAASQLLTNQVQWGSNTVITPGVDPFSSLTFIGKPFSNQPGDQDFELGTIDYSNGTSTIDSIIFGGRFTLSAVLDGGGGVVPYSNVFTILTTLNDGLTTHDNADFVCFPMTGHADCNNAADTDIKTFNIEEGASTSMPPARAHLFGRISGDPFLELTGITIDPASTNAFIGHGLADFPTAVPEPASLLLLGTGLVSLAVGCRQRRR